MTWVLLWLAIALAFGVAEMLTLAFFAVFAVVGAVAAAAAAWLGLALEWQVVVFAVVSVLGVVGARPPLMHYLQRRHTPELLSGAQSMIGLEAPVDEVIGGRHHPGHVRILGERWPAITGDGSSIPAGSVVRVDGLQQATLVVSLAHPAPTQPTVPNPAPDATA